MKTKVLAATAILGLICCGTAVAQWPNNTYGNRINWEVEIGTRILDRPSEDDLNVSLVTLVPQNTTVFNASDATDLDASAGIDFRAMNGNCYGGGWEFRGYFNLWDNTENRSGNLRAPIFTPPQPPFPFGTRPDQFDYHYESELFGFEINYRNPVRPGLILFCGPRYISFDEQVDIDSRFINASLPTFQFNLDSVTNADNQMPGFGIGAEVRRPLFRDVFVSGKVQGAGLANFVSTDTQTIGTVVGSPPIVTTVFDDSTTEFAGMFEVSARLHYDIVPGALSCFAGYEAIWLDGVALAPAQLLATTNPTPAIDASTTTFAHGLSVGGMVRY